MIADSIEAYIRPEIRCEKNLAEKLGLHAPFRTFADRSAELPLSQRKRRRSTSSSSSYLERGSFDAEHIRRENSPLGEGPRQQSYRQKRTDRQLSTETGNATLSPRQKPSKAYERRPRHKTREDRYELKHDKKGATSKQVEKKNVQKRKKRTRKEKSGAALLHSFAAPNVASERLTVRNTFHNRKSTIITSTCS